MIRFGEHMIRSWSNTDVESLQRYANNRKIWLNLRDVFPHPYTIEDAIWWIEHASQEDPERSFAIASEEEPIGGRDFEANPEAKTHSEPRLASDARARRSPGVDAVAKTDHRPTGGPRVPWNCYERPGIGLIFGDGVHRYNAELGYWLAEPFWGRGIMTGAVCALTEYAFRKFPLNRIYAEPFARNLASVRVLEKAGFLREGVLRASAVKDGTILDQIVYAKLAK